jgi:LysR family transcriptional regulator, nitrogen assimilation regulatory protein
MTDDIVELFGRVNIDRNHGTKQLINHQAGTDLGRFNQSGIDEVDNENRDIAFADAVSGPLALPAKPHSLRLEIERLADEKSIPLNIVADSDSSRIVRSYAAGGIAGSILPWSSFFERFSLDQQFARRIVDPEIKRTYLVAWPRGRPLNRPSIVIRDLTLEVIEELSTSFP